jgi:hypothetical protein
MDVLNLWLPLIGGGLLCAVAIGAWFGDQKSIAIWFGFAGLVCLLLLAALQLQEYETASGHVKDDPARPWVGILEVNVRPVQIGNSLETTIIYINSGLSPAQNLRVYAHAQIRLPADGPIPIPEIPNDTPRITLMPKATVSGVSFQGAPAMDAEIVRIITSGERIVWVSGKLEYNDAAKLSHITTFRVKYEVPAKGYVGDVDGNNAN